MLISCLTCIYILECKTFSLLWLIFCDQVDDSNRFYQGRIEELERKVKEYEDKFSHNQEITDVNLQKSKSLIDRLQEEKAMIEVSILKIDRLQEENNRQTSRRKGHD